MKTETKDATGLEKDVFKSMVQDYLFDRGEDDLIILGEPEFDEDGIWIQCVKGADDNRLYTLHYTNDMDIYIVY